MKGLRQAAIALALCSGAAGARAATPAVPPAVAQALRCTPGAACAAKIPVKVVIVTMFEVGQDTGDAPGEFQFWRERRKLDVRIPFPQSHHDLYYNPQSQILGMVTGMGSIRSATATLALGLDQRFDLSHAYWLVAGIAGVDPHQATIGSAVWAHYLVDGDLAHEIDAREIPADWKSGYFALHSNGPGDKRPQQADEGEMFALNPALADWAYGLTKTIALPDSPQLAAARAPYTGMAPAQSPPKVMTGDNLAAMTFWHGAKMTEWAHDWVDFWTGARASSPPRWRRPARSSRWNTSPHRPRRSQPRDGAARGFQLHHAAPGVAPADYLLKENQNYSGMRASLEALYTVGSKVVDTLLADWPRYAKAPPK
jgi:purine nucleoside permease